jgi:hypothetical protein
MPSTRLERERPSEWLHQLEEQPLGYRVLVANAGGLACAAYRLARARCRLQGHGDTPTLRELQLAALLVAERVGALESLPITSLLASDCEEQGLLVIHPVPLPPGPRASSAPPLRRAG